MKRYFLILIAGIFLVGCSGNRKNQNSTSEENGTVVPDMHTSQIALDFWGIYKGVVPCADCEGIETIIELKADETFEVQTVYLGKSDEVFTYSGHYHWNDDGRSIHLHGIENGPSNYFVGENHLIQLDMEGNRITGDLAEKYLLQKID
jgi:uncharacterized lipoprotein NlpE involved in copper resistance